MQVVTNFDMPDDKLARGMRERDLVMSYEAQKRKKRQTSWAKAVKAEMIRRGLIQQ